MLPGIVRYSPPTLSRVFCDRKSVLPPSPLPVYLERDVSELLTGHCDVEEPKRVVSAFAWTLGVDLATNLMEDLGGKVFEMHYSLADV